MGLESVSMAASPICTIMGCRKDWKGFYGSVPHLYDNGVQEGLERLPWQRPHLYDNEAQGWDWNVCLWQPPPSVR